MGSESEGFQFFPSFVEIEENPCVINALYQPEVELLLLGFQPGVVVRLMEGLRTCFTLS